MIEYLADEERDGAFIRVGIDGTRDKNQLCRADRTLVRGELEYGERSVSAGGVLPSYTVHHIINASACARVGVQKVGFVGVGVQR